MVVICAYKFYCSVFTIRSLINLDDHTYIQSFSHYLTTLNKDSYSFFEKKTMIIFGLLFGMFTLSQSV